MTLTLAHYLYVVVLVVLMLTKEVLSVAQARSVRVSDQNFVLTSSGDNIVMVGPNVVVKGPPYLPSTNGSTMCNDQVDDTCSAIGNCTSCYTFNEADVAHFRKMGWNAIRLGVVWAGAQPRDEDALDPNFLSRLHDVLDLCDKSGIHVMLDNHGDMTGTAGCGNGAPMWFQKKAAPELIGKQLHTGLPFSLISSLDIKNLAGYDFCGDNATLWAQHAGDPNYNLLNVCCQQMNSGNPGNLGYTTIAQKTMDYILEEGPGRDDFVRYWRLLAEAVIDHPSAYAAELANEPMSIRRRLMFDTWRAAAEAINEVVPDMAVAITDTGEGATQPWWVDELIGPGGFIDESTIKWIKNSSTLFYAWHWYGEPADPNVAVKNALEQGKEWNVPTFLTEFGDCKAWRAAASANISHTYWHYSSYCNTGPAFGNRSVPDNTFGACILGWAGGSSSKTC